MADIDDPFKEEHDLPPDSFLVSENNLGTSSSSTVEAVAIVSVMVVHGFLLNALDFLRVTTHGNPTKMSWMKGYLCTIYR